MYETLIATLLDAACDLDEDLSMAFEDHIRSMTGLPAEFPLELSYQPYPLSLT